jgi:hypothetical protein
VEFIESANSFSVLGVFMYLQVFIGFLILAVVSCQNQQHKISDEIVETNINSATVSKSEEGNAPAEELVEFFSDDSNIGLPHQNRIEVSNFKKSDGDISNGNIAVIKFYSLDTNKEWKLKQTFEFEKYGIPDGDPKLEDFNNDGFKDLTYVSAVAARGANELRRLFIYDKKKDELIYIKNSESYPNMQYNKELDCIDAWLFHGGTTTVFLKIDGDSLKKFASVDSPSIHNDNKRMIYLIDKNGREKLLRTDKIKEDGYVRYKNFNPPEPYEYEDLNQ